MRSPRSCQPFVKVAQRLPTDNGWFVSRAIVLGDTPLIAVATLLHSRSINSGDFHFQRLQDLSELTLQFYTQWRISCIPWIELGLTVALHWMSI